MRRNPNGAPTEAQRSGFGGERTAPAGAFRRPTAHRAALGPEMSKGAGAVFRFSGKRSLADFATTRMEVKG